MRRWVCLLGLVLTAGSTTGCVDRRYTVYTDPPNVQVLVNGQRLGPSPADGGFVYYGKYNFTLMAPGFETLHAQEDISAPWYDTWPLDFFFENLWPFQIRDVRTFHYTMMPIQFANIDDVTRRADVVREQGAAIRPAPTPPPDSAGVPPAPPAQMPPAEEK